MKHSTFSVVVLSFFMTALIVALHLGGVEGLDTALRLALGSVLTIILGWVGANSRSRFMRRVGVHLSAAAAGLAFLAGLSCLVVI